MKKITSLSPEEFSKFTVDKTTGEITIPEEYELKKIKTPEEQDEEQLAKLISELQLIQSPSDEELIDLGKSFHPYYETQFHIQYLSDLISKRSK